MKENSIMRIVVFFLFYLCLSIADTMACDFQYIKDTRGNESKYYFKTSGNCTKSDFITIYHSLDGEGKTAFNDLVSSRRSPVSNDEVFMIRKGDYEKGFKVTIIRPYSPPPTSKQKENEDFSKIFGVKADISSFNESYAKIPSGLGERMVGMSPSAISFAGTIVSGIFNGQNPLKMVQGMRDALKESYKEINWNNTTKEELILAKRRNESLSSFMNDYSNYLQAHQVKIQNEIDENQRIYQDSLEKLKEIKKQDELRRELIQKMEQEDKDQAKRVDDLVERIKKRCDQIDKEIDEIIKKDRFAIENESPYDSDGLYKHSLDPYFDAIGEKDKSFHLKSDPKSSGGEKIRDKFYKVLNFAKKGKVEEARALAHMLQLMDLYYAKGNSAPSISNRYLNRATAFIVYNDDESKGKGAYFKEKQTEASSNFFGNKFDSGTYEGYQLLSLSNALANLPAMNGKGNSDLFQFVTRLALDQADKDGKRSQKLNTSKAYENFHSSLDYAWSIVDFSKGVFQGVGHSVVDLAKGTYQLVRHPLDSVDGVYQALAHYDKTYELIKDAVRHELNEWDNYSNRERGELVGRIAGEVSLTILPLAKLPQTAKIGKLNTALSNLTEKVILIENIMDGSLRPRQLKNIVDTAKNVGWSTKEINEFSSVYKNALKAKFEIDYIADNIASSLGGKVVKAPIKSPKRAIEKIVNDYAGDSTRIKDLARNTIIVEKNKIDDAVSFLRDRGASIKILESSADPLGYSGVNSTLKTESGIIAEIQVNTPSMIYAKEPEAISRILLGNEAYDFIYEKSRIQGGKGHELYEKWRVLPKDSPERKILEESSKSYYNLVRKAVDYGHN